MFDFGRNWQEFSARAASVQALRAAEQSLRSLLQVDSLSESTFLDLGCGSGLFSVAAAKLGASVTAVDINPLCLQVTRENWVKLIASGTTLRCVQASALDPDQLANLGTFDYVYSWGVLHHTGSMWEAIENTLARVKPEGTLVLSIYNRHITSPAWKIIKQVYVAMPPLIQRAMVIGFGGMIAMAKWLATARNPFIKERGMNFWIDVVDWIGGYPYEYASVEEVVQFVSVQGFQCVRTVPASVPTGCNEFVFTKTAS